jgi:hypothetical protein
MKRILGELFFFITAISLLLVSSLFAQTNKEKNQKCLRCHSMATIGYQDPQSGMLKNLSVIPGNFYNSNHKNLECTQCHPLEFATFPHPPKLKNKDLYCLNCHQENSKLFKYSFKSIEKDFKESVHYQKFGNKFSCFNCHDPHSFKINARINTEIKKTVLYDNHICLECHNNETKIANFTKELIPDLNTSHQWLPHKDLHWKSVRCIDCHTEQSTAGVSHKILPKEKALKNCVECHSSNSILAQSLYKFQTKEDRDKVGFINAVILNNSYVIGATRNYYLNLLSFIIFGITLITLAIHGLMRWNSKKRNTNEK